MRTVLTRSLAAAAVLLVALPVAGLAAEVDDFVAESSTSAVTLELFPAQTGDAALLDLVGTDASVSADPTAEAGIDALTVLGNAVGEVRSASSTGDPVRDPADGDGCAVPVEVTGLTLDAVCATAAADAGGIGDASASAVAELLDARVNGDLLAAALTEPLGDVVLDVTDLLAEDALDQFIAECNALIPPEQSGQIVQGARDLLAMAPEEIQPITDAASEAAGEADEDGFCAAVFNLSVNDIPVVDLDDVASTLAGVDLVTVELDGASSTVEGGDALTAAATQTTATVELAIPELDEVLRQVVAEIVDAIELVAGGDTPLPLSDFEEQVNNALDAIPLFDISGTLLTAVVSGGAATSTLAADGATTAGGTVPSVALTIAPALFELFGQEPQELEFAAGQSQTIAEGTPLESTISVGALTTEDGVSFGDTDLVGSTATASATTVELLTGIEGGITLALAQSSAGAFGAASTPSTPAPDPDPSLPQTGGGAAVAAMLALGGAAALRRRRD